jgi:hypothetical protein
MFIMVFNLLFIPQHAIGDPQLQSRWLPLLQEAVTKGEAEPAHVAYLEDRICFYERRPQRYGTQFDWDEEGQMSRGCWKTPSMLMSIASPSG